jgi:hypothetical protein
MHCRASNSKAVSLETPGRFAEGLCLKAKALARRGAIGRLIIMHAYIYATNSFTPCRHRRNACADCRRTHRLQRRVMLSLPSSRRPVT